MKKKRTVTSLAIAVALMAAAVIVPAGAASAGAADPINVGTPGTVDPISGATVYQLTDETSQSVRTFYYHQNPWINDDEFVYVVTSNSTAAGAGNQYIRFNFRTNTRTVLTAMGEFAGEEIRGTYMYGYRLDGDTRTLTRLDLTKSPTDPTRWTDYMSLTNAPTTPWTFIGSVSINADGTKLLFVAGETDGQNTGPLTLTGVRRLSVLDLTTGAITDIVQSANYWEHEFFSPVDPNLFIVVDQQASNHTGNHADDWYFGDLRLLGTTSDNANIIKPFSQILQDWTGTTEAGVTTPYWGYTGNYNTGHPTWSADGNLLFDVTNHPLNEPYQTVFNLETLVVNPSTPSPVTTQVPLSREESRLLPLAQWNLHLNKTTAPDWYVADGDALDYFGTHTDPKRISLFQVTAGGAKSYPLTTVLNTTPADGSYNPCTQLSPGRDVAITTLKTGTDANGKTIYNLFMIAIPAALQTAMSESVTTAGQWSFDTDGDMDGWSTLNDESAAVSGGVMTLTSTGADPNIGSADALGLPTVSARYLHIRLRNDTSRTSAQVYFKTAGDSTYSQDRSVRFTIQPNSPMTDYVVDMASSPAWIGTLRQLRLDLPSTSAAGEVVAIDDMSLTNSPFGLQSEFDTAGSTDGWTIGHDATGSVANGSWTLTSTGIDPWIISPALSLDAVGNHWVTVRVSNNSAKTTAKIYFARTGDSGYSETRAVAFSILPHSGVQDYRVDLSGNAAWNGTISSIRLDYNSTSSAGDSVSIDAIRVGP